MRPAPIQRPCSIHSVRDGGAYLLPAGTQFALTNLFLNIARVDELFIKIPSERGLADYRKFIKAAHSDSDELRPIEEQERFENLAAALQDFPDLKPLASLGTDLAHYLAVHKLQYERLRTQKAVAIPEAGFGALCCTRLGFFRTFQPAIFQQRIPGATLWQMFDFAALRVTSRFRPLVPAISAQLQALLRSALTAHIDWNIQNFVFHQVEARLYYVDVKPTTFVSRQSNDQNLKGIRDYFLV